jgi:hypothetical protein
MYNKYSISVRTELLKEIKMKKIINRESLKNFTKINNNNNNNNFNNFNDNNTNDCVVLADSQTIKVKDFVSPTALSGLAASRSNTSGEVICSGVGNIAEVLPRNWRGFKLDLFANPSLKLKASVIKEDGTTQELVAALNSPPEYIWRQVPLIELNSSHWLAVKTVKDDLTRAGIVYRASKFATPRKGSSTKFVVFLYETDTDWQLQVVIKGAIYDYALSKQSKLTDAQKKNNLIASLFVGKSQKKLLDAEDLGL